MRPLFLPLILAAGLAAGCAAKPEPTLYERLGGRDAIQAIVIDAFRIVGTDHRIAARFAHVKPERIATNLIDLLCERSGGPCVYRGMNMADAHEGMRVSDAEFDALVDDIVQAMRDAHVPERERRESVVVLGKMRNAIVGH